jgi:hypothetical protein
MFGRLIFLSFAAAAIGVPGTSSAEAILLADGYKPGTATLAAAPGGGTYVLLQSIDRDGGPGEAGRHPRQLEFYRLRPDGGVAAAASLDKEGRELSGKPRLAVLPGGDVAAFLPLEPRENGRPTLARLLRLSPDGEVRHDAAIGHPNYGSATCRKQLDGMLYANRMVAGPRGTVLVGGGYCGGPYVPWWGHFTADGVKLAEGDDMTWSPGPGVTDARFEADGSFRLAGSRLGATGRFDAVIGLYGVDGVLKTRRTLMEGGGEVGIPLFTGSGIAFLGQGRGNALGMYTFDRDGQPVGTAPWTGSDHLPESLIADGDTLAGLMALPGGAHEIVRIPATGPATGKIAWRSPALVALDLASSPTGLRALVEQRDGDGRYGVELRSFPKP